MLCVKLRRNHGKVWYITCWRALELTAVFFLSKASDTTARTMHMVAALSGQKASTVNIYRKSKNMKPLRRSRANAQNSVCIMPYKYYI